MKLSRTLMATLIAFILATPFAVAQSELIAGEITKVDQSASKISIRHGPIKKFDMDGMTMVFRVQDQEMLKKVKVGDKVKFDVDRVNGQYTVTTMQPAK